MHKEHILIAAIRPWNIELARQFSRQHRNYVVRTVSRKEDLGNDFLRRFNPRYIFFPHWSWMIPEAVCRRYECVVFHMTDLPYGRGGSPLQNLIIRGKKHTVVCALQAGKGLDSGPVYCRRRLSLSGSAEEIYCSASRLIFSRMIPWILDRRPVPLPQKGRAGYFARRKPQDSRIPVAAALRQVYDHIRMLDAPGYPRAFLETSGLRLEFSQAELRSGRLTAAVRISLQKGDR